MFVPFQMMTFVIVPWPQTLNIEHRNSSVFVFFLKLYCKSELNETILKYWDRIVQKIETNKLRQRLVKNLRQQTIDNDNFTKVVKRQTAAHLSREIHNLQYWLKWMKRMRWSERKKLSMLTNKRLAIRSIIEK